MVALADVRVHDDCIGSVVLEFYLGLGFSKKDAPVKFKLISLLSNSDWSEIQLNVLGPENLIDKKGAPGNSNLDTPEAGQSPEYSKLESGGRL